MQARCLGLPPWRWCVRPVGIRVFQQCLHELALGSHFSIFHGGGVLSILSFHIMNEYYLHNPKLAQAKIMLKIIGCYCGRGSRQLNSKKIMSNHWAIFPLSVMCWRKFNPVKRWFRYLMCLASIVAPSTNSDQSLLEAKVCVGASLYRTTANRDVDESFFLLATYWALELANVTDDFFQYGGRCVCHYLNWLRGSTRPKRKDST